MPLTFAGDAVGNTWTLCVAGGVLTLVQGGGRRRPGHRSGHVDKTGTETGHIAGCLRRRAIVWLACVLAIDRS